MQGEREAGRESRCRRHFFSRLEKLKNASAASKAPHENAARHHYEHLRA